MVGSIFVNAPGFLAKMMDFGYRNAATLFGKEAPEDSPFAEAARLETPLGILSRAWGEVSRQYANTVGA